MFRPPRSQDGGNERTYQLPTVEEITSRLAKAKYFTVLDASSGFWQLKLDESLCTFNTPFGHFRVLRLPFGVNSAPKVLKALRHNDLLIWGETKAGVLTSVSNCI